MPEMQSNRPRVRRNLVLHSADELYGSDRVLLAVLDALRSGWDPIVVLPDDLPRGPLTAALAERGIGVLRLPLPVLRRRYMSPRGVIQLGVRSVRAFVALVRVGSASHVAVVHTNTAALPIGVLVALALRRPHIWHIHEILEHPRWLGRAVGLATRLPGQRVIAVSNAVAKRLRRDRGRVNRVLRNPAPSTAAVMTGARSLTATPTVLMAGRVNGWKGHDVFVAAATSVHASVPDAVFVMAGGPVPGQPEAYEALKDLVAKTDPTSTWLTFLGWVDDLRPMMATAALVVLPTTGQEPLNITALEAMAMGRPVIASRTGGLVEVVDDGVTGLLVPPGDAPTLARAIRDLLLHQDRAEAMGSAARHRASTEFDPARYAAAWVALYEEAVRPGRR